VEQSIDYHKYLLLDEETGELFWKERDVSTFTDGKQTAVHKCRNWNSKYAGEPALITIGSHGYRYGKINGKKVRAHRVIFTMSYGFLPEEVDHQDRDPLNNKPSNLREATRSGNCANINSRKGATSEFLGVCWDKRTKKWRAQICKDGRSIHLGRFDSEIEAARAYDRAAAELHGAYANLNFGGHNAA